MPHEKGKKPIIHLIQRCVQVFSDLHHLAAGKRVEQDAAAPRTGEALEHRATKASLRQATVEWSTCTCKMQKHGREPWSVRTHHSSLCQSCLLLLLSNLNRCFCTAPPRFLDSHCFLVILLALGKHCCTRIIIHGDGSLLRLVALEHLPETTVRLRISKYCLTNYHKPDKHSPRAGTHSCRLLGPTSVPNAEFIDLYSYNMHNKPSHRHDSLDKPQQLLDFL